MHVVNRAFEAKLFLLFLSQNLAPKRSGLLKSISKDFQSRPPQYHVASQQYDAQTCVLFSNLGKFLHKKVFEIFCRIWFWI